MSLGMISDDSQSILDGNFDFILDDLVINNNQVDYKCHLCHQEFLAKSEFKLHLKEHGQQDSLACFQCHLDFKSSTKLWRHLCKVHEQGSRRQVFRCSLCNNKVFKQAFNYHLHMLIHLEEQPEKCRFCSKAFRTKPSLRKHELIHTGHKRFSCFECSAKFKTKDELKQHSISHTTGKPYRCTFCALDFKYQASLKRHEKKGRCKIGKHWCPTKKRRQRSEQYSNSLQPSESVDKHEDEAALFCDVFLGWETTNVLGNYNPSSSMAAELFSF